MRAPGEFDAAFAAMLAAHTQAIIAVPDNVVMLPRERLAEFAVQQRIPLISGWAEFAQSGGLMTYGPSVNRNFRRLAVYLGKILKGARTSELPIEMPAQFELVVNLRTARVLGLAIPPPLLARADELVE